MSERCCRSYCHQNQHGWIRFLPWAEYALGYQPPLFPWDREPSEVPAVDYWFRESERVWDSAHIHLQRAVRRHTSHADARRLPAPPYHPGDKVWLSTRDIRLRLPCHKLSPHFIRPFTIRRQINDVTYQLDRITPTFHVSLLKPYTNPMSPSSPGPDEPDVPPPPEIANEDSIYRVNSSIKPPSLLTTYLTYLTHLLLDTYLAIPISFVCCQPRTRTPVKRRKELVSSPS